MGHHSAPLRPVVPFPRIPRDAPGRRAFFEAFRGAMVDDAARRAYDWRRDGFSDEQIAEWLEGDINALYVSLRRDAVREALALAGAVAA